MILLLSLICIGLAAAVALFLQRRRRERFRAAGFGEHVSSSGEVGDEPGGGVLSERRAQMAAFRDLDVAAGGIAPAPASCLKVVLLRQNSCVQCEVMERRLARLESPRVVRENIDLSQPHPLLDHVTISVVPGVLIVDDKGVLVRIWAGMPLAGTMENTVEKYFVQEEV